MKKSISLLYSGHDQHHMKGVGILMNKNAAKSLIGWNPVKDRIIAARFQSKHTKITLIQVYAPTENSNEEEKDNFYATAGHY